MNHGRWHVLDIDYFPASVSPVSASLTTLKTVHLRLDSHYSNSGSFSKRRSFLETDCQWGNETQALF